MRDVGNKNLLIVIVLGVIIVGAVLSQDSYLVVKDDLAYDSGSQSSVTCGVYGYRDGEFIPIPVENVLLSPFRIGEEEFAEIAPRVDWVSTGDAIDWATFSLTGSMEIKYLKEEWVEPEREGSEGYWRGVWYHVTTIPFSSLIASDSWFQVFVLGTDLCISDHYIAERKTGIHAGESGWGYAFSGSVDGTVYDEFGGGPLTDSASFGGLSIWITYVATYSIAATIT